MLALGFALIRPESGCEPMLSDSFDRCGHKKQSYRIKSWESASYILTVVSKDMSFIGIVYWH